MKTHVNMARGKGATRVNNQRMAFELKHRILLALNKVGDRDTYQIGVEELDKTIESLTADGVAPFLSCILDTDSEQKSAVRKECVRLMGALATFHESFVLPHLGKIVTSIVKRLKDSDSIVKDVCVETVGVLASKLGSIEGESDGIFVALVKPLFEALGEQNKQVQSGAALCLARVIDIIHNPPVSIMQKMLARIIKMLKNPHFLAKPAVIELNRSIIQAGGAPTNSSLSAAFASIQESLKSSDWITRKAASAALGEIASSGGAFFGSFKSSSLRCLESCRFDKVKPVRDTALQALQAWRNLPGSDTPEPSEAGSSIKENFYRDEYIDVTSTCESTPKDLLNKKVGPDFTKKRIPLSFKRLGQNCVEKAPHPKADDWHIEIAVPKTHSPCISVPEVHYEESQCSSVSKTCETNNAYMRSIQEVEYEYVHVDDKQEFSSASNVFPDNFESKASMVCSDVLDEVHLVETVGTGARFASKETSAEEKRYSTKMQNRQSLESTVTESCSQIVYGCCSQTAKEVASIQKHLLEIENKQSDMMDLLKVFTSNIVDSLSMIQMKVSSLEEMVNGMTQEVVCEGRHDKSAAKFVQRSQEFSSPRISTCTPRPSVELCNRQLSSVTTKSTESWEDKACTRSRQTGFNKPGVDMWTDPSQKQSKVSTSKGIGRQSIYCSQARKMDNVFAPVSSLNSRQNTPEIKANLLRAIEGYLTDGNLDTAYGEALCSGNELVLFELLDRTGPVLDNLTQKTASNLLNTLASHLFKQRFMNPILPWLQQMVDLAAAHGPEYLVVSAKAKREILSAVQQAVSKKFSNSAERRFITELAMSLHQLWRQC